MNTFYRYEGNAVVLIKMLESYGRPVALVRFIGQRGQAITKLPFRSELSMLKPYSVGWGK